MGKSPGKLIGEGASGKVYDVGDGVVVKVGQISKREIKAMDQLKSLPEVPRVIGTDMSAIKNKRAILAMSKVPGFPLSSIGEGEIEEHAWNNTLTTIRKIHKLGIAHNDLHSNNVFYDPNSQKFSIIDFGQATFNNPAKQIEDLKLISSMSTPERNEILDGIIDKYLNYKNYSTVLNWPVSKQQKLVDSVWDEIDSKIL